MDPCGTAARRRRGSKRFSKRSPAYICVDKQSAQTNTETGTLLSPCPNDSRRQPSVRGQVWIVAPGPEEQLFHALLILLLLLLLLLRLRLRLLLC
jgi:hypothetical protein